MRLLRNPMPAPRNNPRSGANLLTLCVAVCAIAVPSGPVPQAQAPDLSSMDLVMKSVPRGPILRVDGDGLSSEEFVELYTSQLQRQELATGESLDDVDRVQLGMQCVAMLVEQEILYREARKRGLDVSDSMVEAAWQREMQELQRGFRDRGLPTPTEQELLERAGADKEKVLAELRKALLIDRMRQQIMDEENVTVSDAAVRERFEEVRGRMAQPERIHMQQIFIRPENGSDAALESARERAEAALQRLRAGQTFEAVARDASDGRLADQGGDPGPLPATSFPPILVETAKGLEPGNFSTIVESDAGFHIVKLNEIIAGEEPDFEEVRDMVEAELRMRDGSIVVRQYVQDLMQSEYEVETFLDLDAQLQARPEVLERLEAIAAEQS